MSPVGKFFDTINFSFEVPIVQDPNTINLHFLFFEAFVGVGSQKEIPDGIELSYDGPVLRVHGDHNDSCEVHRWTRLRHLDSTDVEIAHHEDTAPPCVGEDHLIVAEKVAI